MTEFLNQNIQLVIFTLGGLVILSLLIVYFTDRAKKSRPAKDMQVNIGIEKQTPEPVEPDETILPDNTPGASLAVVINAAKRTWGLHSVKLVKGKEYGRQWLYLNHSVFWLIWKDGTFSPVVSPVDMDHSPGELYEAIQTRDDVIETLGPQGTTSNNAKIGLLIAAAIVAMFLMYLALRGS